MLGSCNRQNRLRTTQERPGLPGRINPDGGATAPVTAFITAIHLTYPGERAPVQGDRIAVIQGISAIEPPSPI